MMVARVTCLNVYLHLICKDKVPLLGALDVENMGVKKLPGRSSREKDRVSKCWLNLLVIIIPAGFVVNYVHANPIAVFFVNFLAVVPMVSVLGIAMDELCLRTGDLLQVLVYMFWANCYTQDISDRSFFYGGLRRKEQYLKQTAASCLDALLSVSIVLIVLPTASYYMSDTSFEVLSEQSHSMEIILILVCAAHLYFELVIHHHTFSEISQKVPMHPPKRAPREVIIMKSISASDGLGAAVARVPFQTHTDIKLMNRTAYEDAFGEEEIEPRLQLYVFRRPRHRHHCAGVQPEIYGREHRGLSRWGECLKGLRWYDPDSYTRQRLDGDPVRNQGPAGLGDEVCPGQSLQTALVVSPVLVMVGWGIDDTNLLFGAFQTVALFTLNLLAQSCITNDVKTHWLKGAIASLS
ncbi:hypothetical protein BJ878DRAFT_479028 [Calycina marina]|uniref:Uncharacterized protein n=1 Tax=Calycina marina TaxID=1763456 RepID=A0A9P7Z679_9HELO|nr:hypothetical protein BJ878DRAFT_479028 [Calycina marina]